MVRAEACGLCSGELMDWYMDKKIPHVFGHEVAGVVVESEDDRYPVGSRVFPHHHAPCLRCEFCASGRYVHCAQWRRTSLVPGGMAEYFAVSPENFNDTVRVDDFDARTAALIEPTACVVKSLRLARTTATDNVAVIGLGFMGLLHALLAPGPTVGFELNANRVEWAQKIGIDARPPSNEAQFDTIFVCPGSQRAFDFAIEIAAPAARIVMFAPVPPGDSLLIPQIAYFKDLEVLHSYSCGPDDTQVAVQLLKRGTFSVEHVVSHFIDLNYLPQAYSEMKVGKILKPMVVFCDHESELTNH